MPRESAVLEGGLCPTATKAWHAQAKDRIPITFVFDSPPQHNVPGDLGGLCGAKIETSQQSTP